MSWCYSNIALDAPWRATLYSELPWSKDLTPSLAGILGFDPVMISIHPLHACHLGVGRDLAASVIRILASKRGYWRGHNQEVRLQTATQRLKWFAKQHRYSVTISKLCKNSLNWKSDCYPELKAKGFDTFVVLRWLNWELKNKDCGNDVLATVFSLNIRNFFTWTYWLYIPLFNDFFDDQSTYWVFHGYAQVVWALDAWLNLLTKSGMFLTDLEEKNRLVLGRLVVTSYVALAATAVAEKKFLFRLRPKFHLMDHLTSDVRASKLNCNIHATWMDEDAVKRWMRIKRQVHKRTASENVLRRFALGLRANLNRGLEIVRSSKGKCCRRWSF